MKQNSSYGWGSFWSFIFWICLIFLVIWWCFSIPTTGSYSFWWWIVVFLLLWWLCDMIFYVPTGVTVDDNSVSVRRLLKSRNISINDIESARPYEVVGSRQKGTRISPAAFSAKWGTFTDPDIGNYVAYYSNPKKTVLITLKNGEKLVVGSADPKALADYINQRVNK